jgi:RimJ/RimL family protein N-acetyltransferase
MKLKPIDSPELLHLVAGWLSEKENYQWLDFGDGKQVPSPAWLKIVIQRPTEVLRVFTTDADDVPIGVMGLTEVNRHFKTARIWALVGDKSFRARGYATRASSAMLTYAFEELGLHAVNTPIVEGNPSVRIAKRLGFQFIGRQRQCHYIDGRPLDKLWFDLLDTEHKNIGEGV